MKTSNLLSFTNYEIVFEVFRGKNGASTNYLMIALNLPKLFRKVTNAARFNILRVRLQIP